MSWEAIIRQRTAWFRIQLGTKHFQAQYVDWLNRRSTPLAFQVMVNDALRACSLEPKSYYDTQ